MILKGTYNKWDWSTAV